MIRQLAGGMLGALALSLVAAPPSDARDLAPQVSTSVVINEVFTRGFGGELDEFLELRNVGTVPVDLSGFALRFYSSNCALAEIQYLPSSTVLQPVNSAGQYAVLIGQNFTGTVVDQTYVIPMTAVDSDGFLSTDAGTVVLSDATFRRVDMVGWAPPFETPCLREGQPARTPPPGLSLSRNDLGSDTDNNRTDFKPTPKTPGAQRPEPSAAA